MNIVFDLGGVVFSWEPEALIARASADPMVRAVVRSEIFGHADWLALDRGTLSYQDAIARAAGRTGLTVSQVAEILGQVPPALVPIPETVELLYRLKASMHKMFCLSNMAAASIQHIEKAYSFWDVFEGRVISCRVHFIKPEPEIYAHLLKRYGLNAAETVFIDDIEANLAAAAKWGMQTIKFEDPLQCEDRLKLLGFL
ncbi:MAG: HAD family phosphatase [Deltaproteobacteria bacterium]|nr:HAD family phosphatase [Deltaproteobacteria bacterium]